MGTTEKILAELCKRFVCHLCNFFAFAQCTLQNSHLQRPACGDRPSTILTPLGALQHAPELISCTKFHALHKLLTLAPRTSDTNGLHLEMALSWQLEFSDSPEVENYLLQFEFMLEFPVTSMCNRFLSIYDTTFSSVQWPHRQMPVEPKYFTSVHRRSLSNKVSHATTPKTSV